MAISPVVQQHQQEMMRGGDAAYQDEQKIFNAKFGNAAYNTFNAKYPQIANFIVTFKVIDSDVDNSKAIGAFILTYGTDVVYVPVIMAKGVIASCEMVYNKTENTFSPLVKEVITDIVNKNMIRDPKLRDKLPPIEDTSQMFTNMFRPPASSHPVIASGSMLEALPTTAKKRISSYLQENPELLAKIAEFYPIETLAEKLTKTAEVLLEKEFSLPDVLGINSLTKEAAEHLTEDQKKTLINDGFLIKNAVETGFISKNDLTANIVNNLELTQKSKDESYGTGKIAVYDPVKGSLEFVFALITPRKFIYKKDGAIQSRSVASDIKYLVAEYQDYITQEDLQIMGASLCSDKPAEASASGEYIFFYPTMSASFYKAVVKHFPEGTTYRSVDNDRAFISSSETVNFSNDIEYGKVDVTDNVITLPGISYYIKVDGEVPKGDYSFIKSFDELFYLIDNLGLTISLMNDGAGYAVKDSQGTIKSLNSSETEKVAAYVHSEYNLNQGAINTLLKDKEIFLFTKEAVFTQPAQEEESQQTETSAYPEIVDDTVDLGDDDLLETGMIASVADEEEVKPLLVDMVPKFTDTNSDLGKTLMVLVYDQENLEDFYGQEEYNSTLTKARRVFRTLGEIISGLKKYINMQ